MADRDRCARCRLLRVIATPMVVGVALAGGTLALAQPVEPGPAVVLEWIAPSECPDSAYVKREIRRLLAGAPAPETPPLRARVEVSREIEERWRVSLTTTGAQGTGHRSLTAETCRALAGATALILALAVDPRRVAMNVTVDGGADSSFPVQTGSLGNRVDRDLG
jgi:hypothetical protein